MTSFKYHTPVAGGDNLLSAINTANGELDAAIDQIDSLPVAVFGHQVANGTAGGSSVATTWNTRALSGLELDSKGLIVISSNQFTPIAGDYLLIGAGSGTSVDGSRLRLYNVTQSSVAYTGPSMVLGINIAPIMVIFTANGSDAYRIDHYSVSANGGNGLGSILQDGTLSIDEIHSQFLLIRIGAGS